MALRGPELAAHVRRGMETIARDAGYPDAAAMCRRLARQGQAHLTAPAVVADRILAALRGELTLPVPEYRGYIDSDHAITERRELLREVS